jgi:hypothetical protein
MVAEGALTSGGKALGFLSLIWSTCDEPVEMTAGPEGAAVLVMQFPNDAT